MQLLHLFNANLKKQFIELKRYLPNTLSLIFTFYFIFLAMFFGIELLGNPADKDINIQYTIVNYIFWFLSMIIMNFIGWEITNEAMRGTLEQLYMSPLGVRRIMMMRMIATTVIYSFIITALLYLSMLTAGQWLTIDVLTILPIMILTFISMYGVAYMIAGLSIIFKQVQAFLQILQFILMGLTFIPLSVAPFLAFAPFVKGVDMVRDAMIHQTHLLDFSLMDFGILALNGVFYLVLGLIIFRRCERYAMERGLLGHY
jgi:ABC-2 type transport system permease protein